MTYKLGRPCSQMTGSAAVVGAGRTGSSTVVVVDRMGSAVVVVGRMGSSAVATVVGRTGSAAVLVVLVVARNCSTDMTPDTASQAQLRASAVA
jgi:hypothetical protein